MNCRIMILFLTSVVMPTFLGAIAYGTAINLGQTGQQLCFSFTYPPPAWNEVSCAGTEQDGDIRAGISWPSPRFSQNADTTLTDNLTGLIWTRNGNIMPSRDADWDADETIDDGAVKWQHALDYLAKLNAENYLGHNDWRLPNVNEIESLINANAPDSAQWLNNQGLVNAYGGEYWSSTTNEKAPWSAWSVNLKLGYVLQTDKWDNTCRLWPVRGGQEGNPAKTWRTGQVTCFNSFGNSAPCARSGQDGEIQAGIAWPTQRFSDQGDETVADHLTGLIWTKAADTPGPAVCTPARNTTWLEALDHVKCLNNHSYLGTNDWRLPNRKEIRSLIDYSRYYPALPPKHPFIHLKTGLSDFYWSSTNNIHKTSEAWMIYLQTGGLISGDKKSNNTRWVWPVRAGKVHGMEPPAPLRRLRIIP